MSGTLITVTGWILLCAGLGFIALGFVGIVIDKEFSGGQTLLRLVNMSNFVVVALALVPGCLVIALGRHLKKQ